MLFSSTTLLILLCITATLAFHKTATLTPLNSSVDGAVVTVLHDTTIDSTNSWNIESSSNEGSFAIEISLDSSWGFHASLPSNITFRLHSDTPTQTATEIDPLFSFSVNRAQYWSSRLTADNDGKDNRIGPQCDTNTPPLPSSLLYSGDVKAKVTETAATRETVMGAFPVDDWRPRQNVVNFPVQFVIENVPADSLTYAYHMQETYTQKCGFAEAFATEQGLQIYFHVDDANEFVSVQSFEVEYSDDATDPPTDAPSSPPTRAPTHSPTLSMYDIPVTIRTDVLSSDQILLVVDGLFNLSSTLLSISDDDGLITVEFLVATASGVPLDYDVIEATLREAMVDEYGDDIEVDIAVGDEDEPQPSDGSTGEFKVSDVWPWLQQRMVWVVSCAGGVCVCCVFVAVGVYCSDAKRKLRKSVDESHMVEIQAQPPPAPLQSALVPPPVPPPVPPSAVTRLPPPPPPQSNTREPGAADENDANDAPNTAEGARASIVTTVTTTRVGTLRRWDSEALYYLNERGSMDGGGATAQPTAGVEAQPTMHMVPVPPSQVTRLPPPPNTQGHGATDELQLELVAKAEEQFIHATQGQENSDSDGLYDAAFEATATATSN